jgi:hypothetical protein
VLQSSDDILFRDWQDLQFALTLQLHPSQGEVKSPHATGISLMTQPHSLLAGASRDPVCEDAWPLAHGETHVQSRAFSALRRERRVRGNSLRRSTNSNLWNGCAVQKE